MKPQKLIVKLPTNKPPFIGVVYPDNGKAIIPQHILNDPGKYTLNIRLGRYPAMDLSRPSNRQHDHGARLIYQYVTYEVFELNDFADKACNLMKVNLGHVYFDETGKMQIAKTLDGTPFVIPLVKFELFDPDKVYGTQGI